MEKVIALIVAIAILVAAYGMSQESSARKKSAQAQIIRAQSQARLDYAQANMPYFVIGVIVVAGGLGLGAILMVISYRQEDRAHSRRQLPATTITNNYYETKNIIVMAGNNWPKNFQPQSVREVYKLVGRQNERHDKEQNICQE